MNRLAPSFAAAAASYDGAGGATLTAAPAGVLVGTRVATPGGAVAIEDFRTGDFVLTPVGSPVRVTAVAVRVLSADALRRDADGRAVRIAAGAIAEGVPRHVLLVAPGQLLMIDGAALPAFALVNGVSITRVEAGDAVTYVRLRLEQPGAFLADAAACAGFGQRAAPLASLAEARRALARRIGLVGGKLMGNVAGLDRAGANGWTLDEAHPEAPVTVELLVRGAVVSHALADLRRPDLAMAGVGGGRCGFNVRLHRKLPADRDHLAHVRRVGDGADVPGSPLLLPRATGSSFDFDIALRHAAANRDGLAAFLAGQVDRLLNARTDRPPAAPDSR